MQLKEEQGNTTQKGLSWDLTLCRLAVRHRLTTTPPGSSNPQNNMDITKYFVQKKKKKEILAIKLSPKLSSPETLTLESFLRCLK